jgi:spermidine synthase
MAEIVGNQQPYWYRDSWAGQDCYLGFAIHEHLHHQRTPYQVLDVFETQSFGTVMTLDGIIQLTDRDNFIYHEMMAHVALFCHRDPKRVLIVGGGDCGVLQQVLQHPQVRRLVQVELDEAVTKAALRFFPQLCTSNGDPRATLLFQDAVQWVAQAEPGSVDVCIVDSTDPLGQAERLFGPAFYRDCHRMLADGGILVVQSESPLLHADVVQSIRQGQREAGFSAVSTMTFPQPTYPSGWFSATLAGKDTDLSWMREEAKDAVRTMQTRYYTPAIHQAAFALPSFALAW